MRNILNLRNNFFDKLLDFRKEELLYLDMQDNRFYKVSTDKYIPIPVSITENLLFIQQEERDVFMSVINEISRTKENFLKRNFHLIPDMFSLSKEDEYSLYSLYFVPDFDESGHFLGVMIFISDVTWEPLEAKDNAIYRQQNKTINKFLAISRVNYNIRSHTYSVDYYLGNKGMSEAIPVEHMLKQIHPDDLHIFEEMLEVINKGEEPSLEFSVRMSLTGLEGYREVKYIFVRQLDEMGKAVEYIGVFIDMTSSYHKDFLINKFLADTRLIAESLNVILINYNPHTQLVTKEELSNDNFVEKVLTVEEAFKEYVPREEWIKMSRLLARMDAREDFGKKDYTTHGSGLSDNDRIYRVLINPVKDHRGLVQEYVMVRMDITEHERQHVLIMESQRLGKMGSWRMNRFTGESEWSEQMFTLVDLNVDEITTTFQNLVSFVHPQDKEYFESEMNWGLHSQKTFKLKFRVITKLGNLKYIECICSPVMNGNSPTEFIYGTAMDVTERELLTSEKQRVSELMNQLINNLPGWVFVKDADNDYRYVVVNELFAHNYVSNVDSMIGKNDFELMGNQPNSNDIIKVTYNMAKDWLQKDIEVMTNKNDDTLVFLENYTDKNGVTKYYKTEKFRCKILGRNFLIGTSMDVTELQEARLKAEVADNLKNAFIMNISHEIRTPLNAIVGFSDILVSDGDFSEEKSLYVDEIKKNTKSLLTLISGILSISKLESKTLVFNKENFVVNDLLKEMFMQYEWIISKTDNVKIEMSIPDKIYMINQDSQRVMDVLRNFMDNAIKFTTEGSISLGFDEVDSGVRIWVKDSGIGIAEEDKVRIFERFEKVNSFIPGTGLGLSICKLIAEEMGGKIGVDSKLDEGSTFWIWLPM